MISTCQTCQISQCTFIKLSSNELFVWLNFFMIQIYLVQYKIFVNVNLQFLFQWDMKISRITVHVLIK